MKNPRLPFLVQWIRRASLIDKSLSFSARVETVWRDLFFHVETPGLNAEVTRQMNVVQASAKL